MTQTLTYNRPKSSVVNSSGMVFSVKGAEKPNTAVAFQTAGSTAEVDLRILCDDQESGGGSVTEMFRVDVLPGLADAALGTITCQVTITPVLGDGSLGTAQKFSVVHPQAMDAWQTAAGRARQP